MLAMQDLQPETSPAPGGESGPAAGEGEEMPGPLPYRGVVARWPDFWRERWGRRANGFEESGLGWRDAEVRAFVEVWAEMRSASALRN
jgi:hypothetical protein